MFAKDLVKGQVIETKSGVKTVATSGKSDGGLLWCLTFTDGSLQICLPHVYFEVVA